MEKYYIKEMTRGGEFNGFEASIVVKVVRSDFWDCYGEDWEDEDDDEIMQTGEELLVFNNCPGKYQWLLEKKQNCECGVLWKLDFNDFVLRRAKVTHARTGQEWSVPAYQVIMVNQSMDAVEAREKGISYRGRTGVQIYLDELNLPLIGAGDSLYYLLTDIRPDNTAYGIPYNINEPPGGGMLKYDKIVVQRNPTGGYTVVSKKPEIGIYNSMLRQLMEFAD